MRPFGHGEGWAASYLSGRSPPQAAQRTGASPDSSLDRIHGANATLVRPFSAHATYTAHEHGLSAINQRLAERRQLPLQKLSPRRKAIRSSVSGLASTLESQLERLSRQFERLEATTQTTVFDLATGAEVSLDVSVAKMQTRAKVDAARTAIIGPRATPKGAKRGETSTHSHRTRGRPPFSDSPYASSLQDAWKADHDEFRTLMGMRFG